MEVGQPIAAAKINWLHSASNENLFYILNVVFKRKFVLQNRHLRQVAGRYGQIKQRRPERAKGLTTRCDKKIVLLYFKSGVQNPL